MTIDNSTNKQTPVKVHSFSGTERTQPSYQAKGVEGQARNTAVINNKNILHCSQNDHRGGQELEIIKEVKSSKPPNGLSDLSGELLPVNSGSEQKFLTNSIRCQNTSYQQTSKRSPVQPATTKSETVANDQLTLGRSGGNQGKEVNRGCGGLTKDTNRKNPNERLDLSLNADTPPSPASVSVEECQVVLSESQPNNSSSSFFVACSPSKRSFSESQSMVNSTPQVLTIFQSVYIGVIELNLR